MLIPTLILMATTFAIGERHIEIDKTKRKLILMEDNTKMLEYKCALGKGGIEKKTKTGDNRTPEGNYRIVHVNKNSKFHIFLHLSYPNAKDIENGKQNGIITDKDFVKLLKDVENGELPSQTTQLGGYLGIHGLKNGMQWIGFLHRFRNWTQGCIALTNKEIAELATKVEIGTKVTIRR